MLKIQTRGGVILYNDSTLNGTDPVLKEGLIPVTIASNGVVRKADVNKKWYSYANKEWANAVILKDESAIYNAGDVIAEENIESYFVWIPKYSYQLWDLGNYNSINGVDTTKVHTIPVKFGTGNTSDSVSGECTTPRVAGESGNCKVGDYMTHPAFLAFNTTGLWVGKFETGYDGATSTTEAEVNNAEPSKVIIKPNVYSWRKIKIGTAFKTSYEYKREYESHMMKNTEWGAVVYLSHSDFGINNSIRINNNSAYITGYAATEDPTEGSSVNSIEGNRFESTALNTDGVYTKRYNSEIGYLASTTGNITGIYDMSGGTWENLMGYTTGSSIGIGGTSEITTFYTDFFTNSDWSKYYDLYSSVGWTNWNNRILGDATGELGPFRDCAVSWYESYSPFAWATSPWFSRGGGYNFGTQSSQFTFNYSNGGGGYSFRIVLAS